MIESPQSNRRREPLAKLLVQMKQGRSELRLGLTDFGEALISDSNDLRLLFERRQRKIEFCKAGCLKVLDADTPRSAAKAPYCYLLEHVQRIFRRRQVDAEPYNSFSIAAGLHLASPDRSY